MLDRFGLPGDFSPIVIDIHQRPSEVLPPETMSTASSHPYAYARRGLSASASASAPVLRGYPRVPSAAGGSRKQSESRLLRESAHDSAMRLHTSDAPRSSEETKVSPTLAPPRCHPYVKHGSGVTLLLTGHTTGTSLPIYQSGSLLSGIAVLDKPACVTSLEIKVRSLRPPLSFPSRGISYSPPQQLEGIVSVREIQGGGSSNVVFFSDQLLTWDTASSCLLDELSFRRVVPAASHDGRLLQPTFDSRLNGIPGFRVSIRWQVVLTVMRSRTGPLSLLRKTTRYVYPQCPTWRLPFMGLILM